MSRAEEGLLGKPQEGMPVRCSMTAYQEQDMGSLRHPLSSVRPGCGPGCRSCAERNGRQQGPALGTTGTTWGLAWYILSQSSYPGVCLGDGLGDRTTLLRLAIQVSFNHTQLMHL